MCELEKIILVGGGGHCKSCIDVIEQQGEFQVAGIVDIEKKIGGFVLGYPIIEDDKHLPMLSEKYSYFLVILGQIKSSDIRVDLYKKIKAIKGKLPTIISPLSYVSKHADIEEGSIVMHHALVNAGARIGKNTIINTKAHIEHDVIIGNHCHISTGAVVNGGARIGNGVFLGSNTVVKHGIEIGENLIIQANTFVVNNIKGNKK